MQKSFSFPEKKSRESKPVKKTKGKEAKPKKKWDRFGKGSFLGKTIPPLLDGSGEAFSCACKRVRLMRHADGGIILYDSEADLGLALMSHWKGPLSSKQIHEACVRIRTKSCVLHPNPPKKHPKAEEPTDLPAAPGGGRTPKASFP